MARQRAGPPKPHSERRVRNEARSIFDQLERRLDTWYGILGLLVLSALVGIAPYCWITLDMAWWKAGAWGLGGTFAVTVVSAIGLAVLEESKVKRAVRRFNLHFPEGTERRNWAVSLLSDFTPTNDGSTKFLSEVLPASMRSNLAASELGSTRVENLEREIEEPQTPPRESPSGRRAPRRRSKPPIREAIPVDLSRDPDALIPLELPPDAKRKGRG
jgi:hypothetical protein